MDIISDFHNGYRYFGYWYSGKKKYGNQIKVSSRDDVIRLIKEHNGTLNCGISISTFINGLPHLLYLPFDFDSNNLRDSFDDAKKLYNTLVDYGYKAIFTFSGSKGFHVLIPVVVKCYSKVQLLGVQQFFKRILNLKTADENIFRDIRRIIRIPGTYHMNGNLCETYMENNEGKLLDIDDLSAPNFSKFDNTNTNNLYPPQRIIHDYPCVEKLIRDEDYWREHHPRNSFEPNWLIRFAWVIEQSYKGKSIDDIMEDIESFGWDDYDEDKAIYNVKYILEKNYVHPTCDTFKDMGFCLEDCLYNKTWKAKRTNGKIKNIN
jgi:hypothetical protein